MLDTDKTTASGQQNEAVNQFARDNQPTLADLIVLVRSDTGLSDGKRKGMIRDIKTASRWFGMPPAEVIAHPMNIRPRFNRLSPGGLGVSTKRIQNVRTSVKAVLLRVNLIDGRSFKVPLTPEWRALMTKIEDRYRSKKVQCIASYASAKGVAPDGVDEELSAAVLTALEADRLHANPRIVHQNAVRAWNSLVDSIANWPKNRLMQPMYRKKKSPDAHMHPRLSAAIEAFLVRHTTADVFDLSAPMEAWKPSTVDTYRRYLKRYFGLLVLLGHAPEDLTSLSDLVMPLEQAKAALKLMMQQNGGESRIGASHIARLLSQVADEAVLQQPSLPEAGKGQLAACAASLRELADRLHKRNKVLGQKNRVRLRPLRDEANLARLFLLPFALAKEVEHVQAPTAGQALRMQWALALMILTFCPLRVTSLCQLRIDRHLVWSRPGSKGELRLEFEWGELKGDSPEVLPLPPECARLVRLYIERFRPALAPRSSPYLFPGHSEARAKLRGVLSGQLQTLVYKRTGFEVNPHLYRHLVHLVVFTRFPGAYAMISRVLAHRSLETARKNYAYFDVELSMNAYQQLIRDVQEGRASKATPAHVAYEIDREDMRDRIH
jgi:integrase